MTTSFYGRLDFLSCLRKYSLCWAFLRTLSMCEDHLRFQEMVVPRKWKWSTIISGLEWVKFQVAPTTPVYQPIHLVCMQTHHCPGSVQQQWCHLQTSGVLQTGPLRCGHLCRGRSGKRTHPWGGASADGSCAGEDAPQSHHMLPVHQEAGNPLTGQEFELGELLLSPVGSGIMQRKKMWEWILVLCFK
ncbi:hypothetical protein ATANTOWER_030785 [Ataeniobius toweri]|uniref:Uncharacterized protein n=1 Tax=Ataeniobius toweri TaxID=208326 RepID=A0ABU7BC74_9TELE|nr:hypothetical protein [Ataeniobius toweri]